MLCVVKLILRYRDAAKDVYIAATYFQYGSVAHRQVAASSFVLRALSLPWPFKILNMVIQSQFGYTIFSDYADCLAQDAAANDNIADDDGFS